MKKWGLLIWVPQFGISVVFPMILFLALAVWLHDKCGWGGWVIAAGIVCGLVTAAIGFRDTIRAMQEADRDKDDKQKPDVSFNTHE